jgi:hypothetical protein
MDSGKRITGRVLISGDGYLDVMEEGHCLSAMLESFKGKLIRISVEVLDYDSRPKRS